MPKTTYNDSPYQSFTAAVPANLVGQEGMMVEIIPGQLDALGRPVIQLYTATGGRPPLGWLFERLEGGVDWNVRLIGKGGTVRGIAGDGSIGQAPCYVKAANGGAMVAANSGDLAHGIKLSPGVADAANDVIEIQDAFIRVP